MSTAVRAETMKAGRRRLGATGWAGAFAVVVSVVLIALTVSLTFGPFRLATTHGTSMRPHFHTGDLVVVRQEPRYVIGDVLAYHSLEGGIVLHRVVVASHDRFVLKGDNNRTIDPDVVHPTQVIGEAEVRVPHGSFLRSPAAVAGLLLILLGIMWFPVLRGRRR